MGVRCGGASPWGPSGGQGVGGACRSEGLVAGEHVPDRFGEPAREVDLRDLGAALFAEPRLCPLITLAVGGVGAGVDGGLDQRPTWMRPAGQGRRSSGSGAVEVPDARWVALPYIGARGRGAGDRIGAAAVHSNAG